MIFNEFVNMNYNKLNELQNKLARRRALNGEGSESPVQDRILQHLHSKLYKYTDGDEYESNTAEKQISTGTVQTPPSNYELKGNKSRSFHMDMDDFANSSGEDLDVTYRASQNDIFIPSSIESLGSHSKSTTNMSINVNVNDLSFEYPLSKPLCDPQSPEVADSDSPEMPDTDDDTIPPSPLLKSPEEFRNSLQNPVPVGISKNYSPLSSPSQQYGARLSVAQPSPAKPSPPPPRLQQPLNTPNSPQQIEQQGDVYKNSNVDEKVSDHNFNNNMALAVNCGVSSADASSEVTNVGSIKLDNNSIRRNSYSSRNISPLVINVESSYIPPSSPSETVDSVKQQHQHSVHETAAVTSSSRIQGMPLSARSLGASTSMLSQHHYNNIDISPRSILTSRSISFPNGTSKYVAPTYNLTNPSNNQTGSAAVDIHSKYFNDISPRTNVSYPITPTAGTSNIELNDEVIIFKLDLIKKYEEESLLKLQMEEKLSLEKIKNEEDKSVTNIKNLEIKFKEFCEKKTKKLNNKNKKLNEYSDYIIEQKKELCNIAYILTEKHQEVLNEKAFVLNEKMIIDKKLHELAILQQSINDYNLHGHRYNHHSNFDANA